MQIEYRIIKKCDQALHKLGEEGWQLVSIDEGKMYFSRIAKKSKTQRNAIKTSEYEEFKKVYPSTTGIYDEKFIVKYNKLVSEGLHEDIIKSVELYKKELEVTGKPVCNPSTFINQQRWKQDFKVTRSKADEWMNDLLKDLNADVILKVKDKVKEREKEGKETTKGALENIIAYYVNQ